MKSRDPGKFLLTEILDSGRGWFYKYCESDYIYPIDRHRHTLKFSLDYKVTSMKFLFLGNMSLIRATKNIVMVTISIVLVQL